MVLLFLFGSTAVAGLRTESERGVAQFVDQFYAGYVKEADFNMEHPDQKKSNYTSVIENNSFTPAFKHAYNDLIENALKEDPEMGLGYDPIIDGQDWPKEGFKTIAVKVEGLRAMADVKKVGWKTILKVGLERVEGKWLINSIGSINRREERK